MRCSALQGEESGGLDATTVGLLVYAQGMRRRKRRGRRGGRSRAAELAEINVR